LRALAIKATGLLLVIFAATQAAHGTESRETEAELQITQITQIRKVSSRNAALREVEIRWIAKASAPVTFGMFDVSLEARYSDGSKFVANSRLLRPSARVAILRIPTHSGSKGVLRNLKAIVRVRLRSDRSVQAVREIEARVVGPSKWLQNRGHQTVETIAAEPQLNWAHHARMPSKSDSKTDLEGTRF